MGPLMLHLLHHPHLPLMLWGEGILPVFPFKANFSENKYITQSILDEHPNMFALTFPTLYEKEIRELQANFLMPSGLVRTLELASIKTLILYMKPEVTQNSSNSFLALPIPMRHHNFKYWII